MFKFKTSSYEELKNEFHGYISNLTNPFDSYLENHIVESNHFSIVYEERTIGYFSIHNKELLTQFYLLKEYRHLSQEIFFHVKKMYYLMYAYVYTSDEFFLGHVLDSYRALENQAYFFEDSKRNIQAHHPITLDIAKPEDKESIISDSQDFIDHLDEKLNQQKVYIAKIRDETIGYGILEDSIFFPHTTSIGMFILEDQRRKGLGRDLLIYLKEEVYKLGLKPIAGCWYYNHFSKKTLENAGMIASSRLLKITL